MRHHAVSDLVPAPEDRLRVGILDPGTTRPETARVVRTLYEALRTFDHHVVVWSISTGPDRAADLAAARSWAERQALDLVLDVGPCGGADGVARASLTVPLVPGDPAPDANVAADRILDLHPGVGAPPGSRRAIGWGVSPTFLHPRPRGDERATFVLHLPDPAHAELLEVVLLAFQEISRVLEDVSLLVRGPGGAGREEPPDGTMLDAFDRPVRIERRSVTAPFDAPARILIHVTPEQGWMTPVAEAMAAGLAVIVPDDPLFAAVVEDAHTGLRVRTALAEEGRGLRLDAVDLADRMLRVAGNPREAERLGRNAAREARRTLSFQAFATRLDATVREASHQERAA